MLLNICLASRPASRSGVHMIVLSVRTYLFPHLRHLSVAGELAKAPRQIIVPLGVLNVDPCTHGDRGICKCRRSLVDSFPLAWALDTTHRFSPKKLNVVGLFFLLIQLDTK